MGNVDTQLFDISSMLRDAAILGAMAAAAIDGTRKDDISEHEARTLYGRSWIEDRTERGQLHFIRTSRGTKATKCYSRFEIETLKRSEKHISDAYNRLCRQFTNNQ